MITQYNFVRVNDYCAETRPRVFGTVRESVGIESWLRFMTPPRCYVDHDFKVNVLGRLVEAERATFDNKGVARKISFYGIARGSVDFTADSTRPS